MLIAIVYDSQTGTTAAAADAMARAFTSAGHRCLVWPVSAAEPRDVALADLICVGSWTQGLLVFGQHPTLESLHFLGQLGDLGGKKAVVFCTYKIAAGPTLPILAAPLLRRGAQVVGQFKFRGPTPSPDFSAFVAGLAAAPESRAAAR